MYIFEWDLAHVSRALKLRPHVAEKLLTNPAATEVLVKERLRDIWPNLTLIPSPFGDLVCLLHPEGREVLAIRALTNGVYFTPSGGLLRLNARTLPALSNLMVLVDRFLIADTTFPRISVYSLTSHEVLRLHKEKVIKNGFLSRQQLFTFLDLRIARTDIPSTTPPVKQWQGCKDSFEYT